MASWPLRLRVALAFLAATAVALVALGTFLHVRVGEALDDRLRDSLEVEADRLSGLPATRRDDAVRSLAGETYGQALSASGEVRASSPLVVGSLLGSRPVGDLDDDEAYLERTITARDGDADDPDTESEEALLLVSRTDDGYLVLGTSREDADEALAEVRGQLLVGGPLALVVAGLLGYLVAGAGLRPIERLRAHAATISARTAGERLPLPAADDELRRLAVTLNEMLDRLDVGLQRERRFVAEAGHDLRTPLTLMRAEIDLALERPRTPEELTEALRSTHDEVRRLIALTEDLLAGADTAPGSLPIEVSDLDLGELARDVVARFRTAAGERAVRLAVSGPVEVPGDSGRLDRVLSNLIDNALRHGAGDVEVEVEVERASDGAVVTVSDAGPGFAADGQATDGGGLGLAIVREIVAAHGGTLEVRREAARTRVRVGLPAPPRG